MCGSSAGGAVANTVRSLTRVAGAEPLIGDTLTQVIDPITSGITKPILGDDFALAVRADRNERGYGQSVGDVPKVSELLEQEALNDASAIGDPLDPNSVEAQEAARQARFDEDERIKRFKGFGSTLLTGGQGDTSTATGYTPTLLGV